jgi:hypothetical protein
MAQPGNSMEREAKGQTNLAGSVPEKPKSVPETSKNVPKRANGVSKFTNRLSEISDAELIVEFKERGLLSCFSDYELISYLQEKGVFKAKETAIANNGYENVNHPSHYNLYSVEAICMIERIWGKEATIKWCEITAFKYRMRMGLKPGNSIEQDMKKERFYLDMVKKIEQAG